MQFSAKTICGATFLLAAGSAAAESNVTLYGVVDTFMQYLNNGGHTSYSERSGGESGSRFGLLGREDLGGGLQAKFDIETGYNVNNGTLFTDTTALFYRQGWVGLSDNKYGSLTFGRQYQPSFNTAYGADPFALDEVLSPLVAAVLAVDRNTLSTQSIAGRTSNAVLYQSPDFGGVRLAAMYAFAATVTQPVPASTGNLLDVSATYTGYGLYASVAYQSQRPGTQAITVGPLASLNLVATEHFTGALAYRFGIANIQFLYTYARPHDAPAGSAAALAGTAHPVGIAGIGVTIQASPQDVVEISGIERNVRGSHDNTLGIQLGYDHLLSKRTSLYVRAGHMKNNGTATTSWAGIRVATPTGAPDFGASQTLVAVGVSHRF
ncbi:porin [Burkholderia sp. Bp8963]|uniref:porin n=1 Tax=Burkholderia sp. Bp8963 TaxID=2184547 RepID=UPI000F596309|nr:porin [Burkholderia sp. Bp8963]RQS66662.1 porin [Burkholderia sp. Bp8963]